jgi:capsular polysaccharide transport system permease protein
MKINLSNRTKTTGLLLLCAIPALYLWLIAQDRFQCVSHFSVVVEESNNAEASMGLLSLVGGGSSGTSDSQIVIGFISSSDLLFDLEDEFKLSEHYASPPIDFIFRLESDATKEDRIEYYRNKIHAHEDPDSGLIYLTVESFSPQLSEQMSKHILTKTDEFINELNKEVANKQLSFAKAELERAHSAIKEDEAALIAFQNKFKVIQPDAIIQAQLAAIQTLRLEKIHKEIELATIEASSPNAPSRKSLGTAISHLASEIEKQEAALSGQDMQKLNQLLAQYKGLELNLELSINLRSGAELILEKTRAEAIATSRFFSVIQNPYLPDDSTHPRRWYLSLTLAAAMLLALFIIQALIASLRDRV